MLDRDHTGALRFAVSRDGAEVDDLQPYLGSRGHLVMLRVGDLAYEHVHPATRRSCRRWVGGRASARSFGTTPSTYAGGCVRGGRLAAAAGAREIPALQFHYWQWISLQLATPVLVWAAWPFHRAAWMSLRHGTATMTRSSRSARSPPGRGRWSRRSTDRCSPARACRSTCIRARPSPARRSTPAAGC